MKRLKLAWRVFRQGLPDVEVFYRKIRTEHHTFICRTEFDYPGVVKHIDEWGQLIWSDNGTFAIEQELKVGG